jgi:hypothetical protein
MMGLEVWATRSFDYKIDDTSISLAHRLQVAEKLAFSEEALGVVAHYPGISCIAHGVRRKGVC